MELREAMRTTPSCRAFTDEPVSDDDLHGILDDARFAGSGGNRQGWRVMVVRDRPLRVKLRELIVPVWRQYVAQMQAGERPFNPVTPTKVDLDAAGEKPAPLGFVDRFEDVPVMLIVAVDMRELAAFDKDLDRYSVIGGGSIYPFCQNILLAARDRDLGATMTTFLVRREPEAMELLGVPETHALVATIAIGHPEKQLTRLSRKPVEDFAVIDRFDGSPFDIGSST